MSGIVSPIVYLTNRVLLDSEEVEDENSDYFTVAED